MKSRWLFSKPGKPSLTNCRYSRALRRGDILEDKKSVKSLNTKLSAKTVLHELPTTQPWGLSQSMTMLRAIDHVLEEAGQ